MVSERARPPQFLRRVRNRPALRRRSRLHAMIRAIVLVGGIAVAGFAANIAYRYALATPALSLQRVVLQQVPDELIQPVRGRLRPHYGDNLLALDMESLRHSIEALPAVRTASLRRLLPDSLAVSVEPRTPRLRVEAIDGSWVVDDQGIVLAAAGEPSSRRQLPVVRLGDDRPLAARPGDRLGGREGPADGIDAAIAVAGFLDSAPAAEVPPVDHLRLDPTGVVLVLRHAGLEAVIGDARDLGARLQAVRALLDADPPSSPAAIDARYRDMLVVRRLDGATARPPTSRDQER